MVLLFISLLLAYMIGSIPTSFIFTKIFKRIDIRKHGSGNVGATNVFRVVGKVPAIIVLGLDIFKGFAACAFLPDVFYNNSIDSFLGLESYTILLGAAAISGHLWSIFLKFTGGKGVATTAGVLLALAPEILAFSALVWVAVFLAFRIVSVASIATSVVLPVLAILFHRSIFFILFCVLVCIVGTYKHKANIKRLIRGEEKKLI